MGFKVAGGVRTVGRGACVALQITKHVRGQARSQQHKHGSAILERYAVP